MWRLFRREQQGPAPFYRYLASELVRDLEGRHGPLEGQRLLDLGCGPGWYAEALERLGARVIAIDYDGDELATSGARPSAPRSEEHTSELQSLMRNSYAVFCLKKKYTKLQYTI